MKRGRCENELQKINFQFVNSLSRLQLSLNRPLKYICMRGRRQTPVLRMPVIGEGGNAYFPAPLHHYSRAIAKKNFRFPMYSKTANGFLCTQSLSIVFPGGSLFREFTVHLFYSVPYLCRLHAAHARCPISSRRERITM